MTLESSTTANVFCGEVFLTRPAVAFSKMVEPSGLNWRLTTQLTEFCGMPAWASVNWSPRRMAGASRNFDVPARSHAMSGWSGTSGKGSPHVKFAKSDWSRALGVHARTSSTVGWTAAGVVGRGVGTGVGSPGRGARFGVADAAGVAGVPSAVGWGTGAEASTA